MSDLPAQTLRRIDRICTRFESEWKSGTHPRIEQFCSITPGQESSVLFKELLLIDLDYRHRQGDQPAPEEYRSRFPDQSNLVGEVWQSRRAGDDGSLPEIPGYDVLRRIGRGGMAVVYLARDQRLGRLVALKLISAIEPSDQLIGRLRAEAQAVARMQHPNIVQIHEIGEHAGRPYLALEYVSGGSLAEWIAGNPRPPREAAQLVEVLARAVHAAHQHGIVHRDLKPANVLLEKDPLVPKITDFGLVKFLDETDPRQTQSGVVVGTASYMAPEQADAHKGVVGPAADIYALGAILYELITGRPPFKAVTVFQTTLLVRNTEPVAPRQLQPHTPRDLETVCLRCLEKEPARRYPSAVDLANDLARFLSDQPVSARPVGSIERAWRWSRRNRLVAGLAAVVALVLVAGTVVSSYFAFKANRRAAEAQERREQAEIVSRFLVNVFRSADPNLDGRTITIAQMLDRAVIHLDSEFADRPLIRAELTDAIGQTYLGLGLPSQALDLLERSRALLQAHAPADDPRLLATLRHLASACRATGDLPRALTLSQQSYERTRAGFGEEHPQTIEAANALAMVYQETGKFTQAAELHEKALAWARVNLGETDPNTLGAMNSLAWIYQRTGQTDKAIALFEQALSGFRGSVGSDHPQTLATMNNLALAYSSAGRLGEATELLEQVLESARMKLGENHPNTLATLGSLARAYREAGRYDQALPLAQRALELKRAKLGADHPDTLNELAGLAVTFDKAGHLDKALPLYEQVLQKRRGKLGDDHPNTLLSFNGLGSAYRRSGNLQAAESILREGLSIRERITPDDWSTCYARVLLGGVLVDLKRFAEAEPNLLQGYEGLSARLERIPPAERFCMGNAIQELIDLYEKWGKPQQAAEWRARLESYRNTRTPRESDHGSTSASG